MGPSSRSGSLPAIAGAVVLAVVAACGVFAWRLGLFDPRPPHSATREALVPERSNLLLISIDTLRADRLPVYGYAGVDTPALSRLAREGVTARAVFTPVPLTLPAHASLLTGLQPYSHGVRDNGGLRLPPSTPTLATIFASQGYRTGAFVSAFVLDSRWGLDKGFETYFDDFAVTVGDLRGMAGIQRRGDETWDAASRWLAEGRQAPFFLWLHLFDPHTPYAAPEPYGSRYADRPYDGEVAYVDSIVGAVVARLESDEALDNTTIVVVGDHGEGLGDHGEDEHGLLAYDSTLRVPWIIRLPGRRFAGATIDIPASLADVAPTLTELFGVSWPGRVDGVSRLHALTTPASAAPDVVYSETFYPRLHFGWSELLAARDGRFKYIRAPRRELYDVAADPGELRNVIAQHPDEASRLDRILTRMTADTRPGGAAPRHAVDLDSAKRLQALGYVASSPTRDTTREGDRADPKDKAALFRTLMRARMLLDAGQATAALRMLEGLVSEDPAFDAAHRALREHLVARGQGEHALRLFTEWLRTRPNDVLLLLDVAFVHRSAGSLEASRAALQRILDLDPDHVEALRAAGEVSLDLGRSDEAVGFLTRALNANPDADDVAVKVAVARLRLGQVQEAESVLAKTTERNPDVAGAHYLRAQIAEHRGDLARAESEYKREIELHPWDYQARFNLALLLGRRAAFAEQIALLDSIPGVAPSFKEVHFYRAKAYLDSGDRARLADAIAAARLGLKDAPSAGSAPLGHYVLADVYSVQGRSEEAARELAKGRALEARLKQR